MEAVSLEGKFVRLEPLEHRHGDALLTAAAVDPSLYQWTAIPQCKADMTRYIATALAGRDASTALPFVTIRSSDGVVIGSTRFFDLQRWAWPAGHPCHGRSTPDVCEIGYTWLTKSAIRTAANTEAKLLMLTHGFETWRVHGVCLHTDRRNERSRAAMERMGATFEGILRAHRMATDLTPRDSARFSIVAADWPEVKQRLLARLDRA